MNENNDISRRRFIESAAAAFGALGLGGCAGMTTGGGAGGEVFRGARYRWPVAVATWDQGLPAVVTGLETLGAGGSALDAVEKGINTAEQDPAESSVGVGGLPNEDGIVQLDAAIMNGDGLRCGSVFALEGIDRPISVARRVMERTRHIQLAQEGARRFALAQGFETTELLTPASTAAWEKWRDSPDRRVPGQVDPPTASAADHDTISMVVLDSGGAMAAGCSTSGLAWKMSGRVGDSPIIGAGVYCDGGVGGAGATGVGEEVLRVCGSFLVVEEMRRGASPQAAVETALRRILDTEPDNRRRQVAFIALSKTGEVGAASIQPGFELAVASPDGAMLIAAHALMAG